MIRVERSHLQIQAVSHPGMTGKNNEDRYAVSAYQLGPADPTPVVFAILADGIGGHRGGEVAAEMVVELISRRVAESEGLQPTQTLNEAVIEASQHIFEYAQSNGSLQGMGATCACAWIIGSRLYITAIGDSRIYLMRADGGTIRQVTTDHTWIQEAIDKGVLKRGDARGHPNAHVIRRFLGSPTPPQVDLRLRLNPDEDDLQAEANQGLRLRGGDRLLLCSDGLTDLVQDSEILQTFANLEQDKAVQALVDMALQRGGHDNVTIIAVEVPAREGAAGEPAGTHPIPARQTGGETQPVALEGETTRIRTASTETVEAEHAAPKTAPTRRRSLGWFALGCGGIFLLVVAAGLVFYRLGGLSLLGLDLEGQPTRAATLTLPPELLTALPGGGAEGTPTAPLPSPTQVVIPSRTPTPSLSQPLDGPTYTPWPTNTLPAVQILSGTTAVPYP